MARKCSGLLFSEIKRTWENFCDYEFARRHHDVDATWRVWCRKEKAPRKPPAEKPASVPVPPILRPLLEGIGRPMSGAAEDAADSPVPNAAETRRRLYGR